MLLYVLFFPGFRPPEEGLYRFSPRMIQRGYGRLSSPIRNDFLINDDTTGFLWQTVINADADSFGNRFILLRDTREGTPSSYLYILDASGNLIAGPLRAARGKYVRKCALAVSSDGKAFIGWEDGYHVWIAMYDRYGNEVLSPTAIDSGVDVSNMDAASNDIGGFVLAYDTDYGNDPKFVKIDSSGGILGMFLYSGASSRDLRVSMDNSGNVVMVWRYYDFMDGFYEVYYCLVDGTTYVVIAEGDVVFGATGNQRYPDVWMNPNTGEFYVVWLDDAVASYDVLMESFDASGTPGAEVQVNDGGSGTAVYSPVSIDGADGWGMVVGWTDNRNGDNDIYIQRFDASGSAAGSNLKVNSDIGYGQSSARVGVGSNGDWIVAWEDERYTTEVVFTRFFLPDGTSPQGEFAVDLNEGSTHQFYASCALWNSGGIITWMDTRYSWNGDIFAQFIDSLGNLTGSNFLVADDTTGEAYSPDVAFGGDNVVVVWVDNRNGSYLLYGQRYGIDGTPYGTNFQISRKGLASPIYGVDADKEGNFVAVWMRNTNDIVMRRYNSAGIPLTDTVVVNDVKNNAGYPDVGMDPSGNFVIVWNDWSADGTHDVYMQLFDSTGTRIGTNISVIDRSTDVYFPRVARSKAGFVVVWADTVDGGWKIYAQIYQPDGNPYGTPFAVSSDSIPSIIFWMNIYYWTVMAPEAVVMDSIGNFMVGWITAGDNGDPDFVVRGFYADGTPMGPEVIVNDEPLGDESQLTIGNSGMVSCGDKVLLTWGDGRRQKGLDIYAELNTFDIAGVKTTRWETGGGIFSERYTISFEVEKRTKVNVRVYDISGRTVYKTSTIVGKGMHNFTWKPVRQRPGIYFITVEGGKKRKVEKVLYLR